ncbi:MAG: RAMP superfamily CRISPR-associated protein [Stellaceae bacterium]
MSEETQARPQMLHLARATLEALSPISLGSGEPSSLSDALMFRDANDLPAIPGASLQGGLRHLWGAAHDQNDPRERTLFGAEDRNGQGKAGRLIFGFGAVHGADDAAVAGLLPWSRAHRVAGSEPDPVLNFLACYTPVLRHHVKLNDSHVADDRAKFDRSAAPVGTRFSFEIAMWGEAGKAAEDKAQLIEVLKLLRHPAFRLGGAGRRGYGRARLIRASYDCRDPRDTEALRAIRGQPPSAALGETLDLSPDVAFRTALAELRLHPLGPWRIGTTFHDDPEALTTGMIGIKYADPQRDPYRVGTGQRVADTLEKAPDILILGEPRILWRGPDDSERAVIEGSHRGAEPLRFVVPGSALRGPLAHRMLFHWYKAHEHFIDAEAWIAADEAGRTALEADWKATREERPKHWSDLLGLAKERGGNGTGQASRLFVNDGIATDVPAVQVLTHNVIDRFSGGVVNEKLYSEEVALGGEIAIEIAILPPPGGGMWDERIVDAFLATLRDLVEGRLAIGAKSLGFCTGSVSWSGDAGQWSARWANPRPTAARAAS